MRIKFKRTLWVIIFFVCIVTMLMMVTVGVIGERLYSWTDYLLPLITALYSAHLLDDGPV
jgi:uncharacterized membrane protein